MINMLDRTIPPASAHTFELNIPQAQTEQRRDTLFHWISAGKLPAYKLEVLFRSGGSFFDPQPGTAYITNKMLTYGTNSRSHAAIVGTFEQFGAFVKVNPSFDDPSISIYGLNHNAAEVIPVLADVVRNSVFPDEEFELVRRISIEQLHIQNSRNSVQASKIFREALFGKDHPYGRVMGIEDLEQMKGENIREFYHSFCGDYEVITTGILDKELKDLITGHLDGSSASRPTGEQETAEFASKIYREKEKSLQSSLRIGIVLPHKSSPDYIPLRICIHALGGYFGSRLMKNIREEKGYTYGIYASMIPLRHASYMMIGGDVQKEHRQDAIDEVYHEIRRLQDENIPERELQMVRNHLLGSLQSDLSSPFSLAGKFKGVHLFGLDYSYYDQLIETIQRISPDTIREMAVKYLPVNQLTEVSVG